MPSKYSLNGNWTAAETEFFMKAMFCRQVDYENINDKSIEFLKEWAGLGEPFSSTNYDSIFDNFKEEFQTNSTLFLDGFFNELASIRLEEENIRLLISMITDGSIRSGFQLLLLKTVCNVLSKEPIVSEDYEPIRKMKCSLCDIDYFLEKYPFFHDNTALLDKIVNEHNDTSDEYSFPDVYVSERFLREEEKEDLLIKIDSSIALPITSLTIKIAAISTFQELLNTLFNHLLSNKVGMYSYGKEWMLSKYDGIYFTDIEKPLDSEQRSLARSGINQKSILRIRLIPVSQSVSGLLMYCRPIRCD